MKLPIKLQRKMKILSLENYPITGKRYYFTKKI